MEYICIFKLFIKFLGNWLIIIDVNKNKGKNFEKKK